MPPRKHKLRVAVTNKEIIELLTIPDTSGSEDSLEDYESEPEDNQSLASYLSVASTGPSTSTSSSINPNPSTSKLITATDTTTNIIIDRIFQENDSKGEWSSSDEEPLQTVCNKNYNLDITSQRIDPVHDDAELCVSDAQSDDSENSDYDETEWKKVNLEQIAEINRIFQEDGFDVGVYPIYFFSIVSPPIEYFERFFANDVMNLISVQTNLYAHQNNAKNWTDTNATEIKALLGIHLLMSLHPLPQETQYWSSDPLYHVQPIADIMPLKRYKKLMECFHLNDNTKASKRDEPGYDKLFKLRPLIDLLNDRFSRECSMSKSQSIDECMVKFKGRSSLKQYMPMKPIKRGYKIWARADSSSGYLYQFEVYCGKTEGVVEVGLGPNVVLRLSEAIRNKGCHVTFDNFFTSVALMRDLYAYGIHSTGTIRSDRRGLPKMVKNKNRLQKHTSKWRVDTETNTIASVLWKDTKPVNVLTTGFDPKKIIDVQRTQKDGNKALVKCPLAIAQYTKRMGGVDQFDQFRSHYKIGRRSKKWWLRLFYFLLEAAAINSFILYKVVHNGKKISQIKFRERLAYGLIDGFTSRKRTAGHSWKRLKVNEPNDNILKSGVPREIRYAQLGVHWPEELPSFRRCYLCSTRTKNKRSRFQCSKCQVALCVAPCFSKFHQTDNYTW